MQLGVGGILEILSRIGCIGEERLPQRVIFGQLVGGKGYAGGQENDWMVVGKSDCGGQQNDWMVRMKEDMSAFGLEFGGWRKAGQKASRWFRRVGEGAESFMPYMACRGGLESCSAAERHA